MFKRFLLISLCILLISTITAQDSDPVIKTYTTQQRINGNRFVDGTGTFPAVQAVDLPLEGAPAWVVLAPTADGFEGVVILAGSRLQSLTFEGQTPTMNNADSFSTIETLSGAAAPPLLYRHAEGDLRLNFAGVPVSNGSVILTTTGHIRLNEGEVVIRDAVPLPDARIIVNAAGQAAIYTGATDQRYVHNVLGDALEAASMLVLDTQTLDILARVDLPGDEVFEGISPFWADVDEDGTDDLVTTVSAPGAGAQIRVYTAAGDLLASGPAIGLSNRWRHQLAWGAFGPAGENQLVEVLTPHIGGIVGFYQYDGADGLEIVARRSGYTSHVIGSNNLDMAVAGDFDGDGQPEMVLPSQARDSIGGLAHTVAGEVQVMWTLPLNGLLMSNLSALPLPDDGGMVLAAGITEGETHFLRIWIP